MSKPAIPAPPAHVITIRRMKSLVLLLILSNVATGLFSVYLMRAVDQRYSTLIDRSVPVLNDLRELMTDAVQAMRTTNPTVVGNGGGGPDMVVAMRTALATAQRFCADMLAKGEFKDEPASGATLGAKSEAFNLASEEVVSQYVAGDPIAANRIREAKLRPAFDQYMAAISGAADAVEARSLAASRDYTNRTKSFSTMVMGMAGWPLLLLMGLLLLTTTFLIVLTFVFRSRETTTPA
jgi:hypothetical protein